MLYAQRIFYLFEEKAMNNNNSGRIVALTLSEVKDLLGSIIDTNKSIEERKTEASKIFSHRKYKTFELVEVQR